MKRLYSQGHPAVDLPNFVDQIILDIINDNFIFREREEKEGKSKSKDKEKKTKRKREKGMEEDEVLYADDTICMSEDEGAMNRILKAIETEGTYYGLRLNKNNCESMKFGDAGRVKSANGTLVPPEK